MKVSTINPIIVNNEKVSRPSEYLSAEGEEDFFDASGRKKKAKKKLTRPVSVKNTRIVTFGTKNNFNKRVYKAFDGDKFFNANGEPSNNVENGL